MNDIPRKLAQGQELSVKSARLLQRGMKARQDATQYFVDLTQRSILVSRNTPRSL